jgi:hypothetical protein
MRVIIFSALALFLLVLVRATWMVGYNSGFKEGSFFGIDLGRQIERRHHDSLPHRAAKP